MHRAAKAQKQNEVNIMTEFDLNNIPMVPTRPVRRVPVFKCIINYGEKGSDIVAWIDSNNNLDRYKLFDTIKGEWILEENHIHYGIAKLRNPDNFVIISDSPSDEYAEYGYNCYGMIISDRMALHDIIQRNREDLLELPEFARLKDLPDDPHWTCTNIEWGYINYLEED